MSGDLTESRSKSETSPIRVYLVSRPQLDVAELLRFLSDRKLRWARTGEARESEEIIEICGRICYMSFSDDKKKIRFPNKEYIENLVEKGHESVLEHASWTFIIDGVTRAFTHQLVRHRVGFAFSQLSQQYHDESDAKFLVPTGLVAHPELYELWRSTIESSHQGYRKLLRELERKSDSSDPEKRRWIRTAARSVLPNAVEAPIAVTANARALRHFFDLRGAIEGDHEMRFVSSAIFQIVANEAPALFSDFESYQACDGYPKVSRRQEK